MCVLMKNSFAAQVQQESERWEAQETVTSNEEKRVEFCAVTSNNIHTVGGAGGTR
jgi:hypothetical protein